MTGREPPYRRRRPWLVLATVAMLAGSGLAATPSPTPSPDATPTSTPSPAPSPTPASTPSPTPAPIPSPTSSATPMPQSSPAPSPPPTPPAAGQALTLTAASAPVTGFAYRGVVSLAGPSGTVRALEFTIAGAGFAAGEIAYPCAGSRRVDVRASAPGSISATSITLHAVFLAATIGGTRVTYTAAAPPPQQPLPDGSGTLTGLQVVAVNLRAATLDGGSFSIQAC